MSDNLTQLRQSLLQQVQNSSSIQNIESLRIKYLGRKGEINKLMETLPTLPKDERGSFGKQVNELKETITQALKEREEELRESEITKLSGEKLDVTIPGIKPNLGHINPLTQVIGDITRIFDEMGYEIVEGPEIETDHYNFEVLNIPKTHPARDLQDTFWLTNGFLPRTHTSAMQVRVMEKRKPPFKIAVPGWAFRSEREDATHAASFHHYEGFVVGDKISFSDLKGTLTTMLRKLLGEELQVKFRASYFPYVEPCAEVSVSCPHCKTKGCKACGGSGWLEIMGSGMIHPTVLKNAKIDPKKYSGFAYVFGTTRIAMIKYRINDIRLFTGGDLRFLEQF